jgi:16S rRNA processing protein RimM
LTDFPQRFAPKRRVFAGDQTLVVKSAHWHQGQARVIFVGVETPELAESMRDTILYADPNDHLDLEADEFRVGDLVGRMVVTEGGKSLGPLDKVLPYPAQDLLVIGDLMIPFASEFVVAIEPDRIVVRLIEGMEDTDVS